MFELLSLYYFIPPAEKKQYKHLTRNTNCQKGDFLLFDGDKQTDFYVIRKGVAGLYLDLDPTIQFLDFSYQNQFCADINSFSKQSPSKYNIQCLEDCEVESISYDDLQSVFNISPATERAYRLWVEERYEAVLEKSFILTNKNIRERFEWIMCGRPELFKLVPHKYLASHINIDPTNFSKLYNQLCINNGLLYS